MKGGSLGGLVVAWCFSLATGFAGGDPVKLTAAGEAVATLVLSDEDETGAGVRFYSANVESAAEELRDTVEKISGASLPISRVSESKVAAELKKLRAEGKTAVVLGELARKQLGALSEAERSALEDPTGFILRVEPGMIAIAGGGPRGTEIGVYELLEQLGVRWFFPGEWGTVIPRSFDLEVASQGVAQRPSFGARYLGFNALDREPVTVEWKKHQREGGPVLPPAHGIKLGADASFEAHPEFYALVDGKRTELQLCLTHPDVLPRAIQQVREYFRQNPSESWIGMGPKDGSGFCECEKCRALDSGEWDAFSSEPSVTDRYVWFFNRVLEAIKDEFPDRKIAFYVYHCYMLPPVREKPNPKIVAAIAPIGLCRIHGMNNPVCPERSYLKTIVDAWTRVLPEVYERGYWFNLADPGTAFIQVHRMRDEIPYYAVKGTKGFRTECSDQWASQGPSLYVAGRLMWDAKADPDKLVADFCEKLFGPAEAPMRRFFQLLDSRLKEADHHTGGSFDLLRFYPPQLRGEAVALLGEAGRLATSSPFKERVDIFSRGFAFTERFAAMMEARNEQQWDKAATALKEVDKLRDTLTAYAPPMLSVRQSESYLRRFYRQPVEQGAARVNDGNTMVAPLSDEWEFLIDPQKIGEGLHYEREGLTGGNWQRAATSTRTWSDQGLRYYKGLAWYRQAVDISEEFAGRRMFLWFGGVDETARIWVNGRLLGTSPSSAFTPFEVDATKAVRTGENEIVVCVANERTDELGTGGIVAPAFLYAPAKGDAAELQNVAPLRDTFP